MYFFSFEMTIIMSRSTMSLRWTAPSLVPAVFGAVDVTSPTMRRAPIDAVVGTPVGGVENLGGKPGCAGLAIAGCATGPVPGDGRTVEGAGAAGRGAPSGCRAGSGDWLASSRSHVIRVGAILSSAHASRWRRVATWLSQHTIEQNTRRIRARLQVETLHWKYFEPNAMSVRQAVHKSQVSAMQVA